jgi:RNA polymerase sigma factor (sigma-70 family)
MVRNNNVNSLDDGNRIQDVRDAAARRDNRPKGTRMRSSSTKGCASHCTRSQRLLLVRGACGAAGTRIAARAHPLALDIDQLYRTHKQHLLRFVQRYVRNAEDTEDVVQNTFVEAMRCAQHFSGLSKPSTWLFGIALNLARNQARRNGALLCETIDDSFLDQIADPHADPAMLIELRQIVGKVDVLLSQLSPKIRSTFETVLDGEATYEEAAEQLQIPVGTVRSRVARVRAVVRAECCG